MTLPAQSLNSKLNVAAQASKGTAATTGFITGRMRESYLYPEYDVFDPGPEHTGGSNTRTTAHRNATRRPSYLLAWGGRSWLYPDMVGVLLKGLGFGISTTDNTTYKTHTATLANRADQGWLSVMHSIGDGADAFERKAKDARLTRLTVNGTGGRELDLTFEGIAMSELTSAGTESVTAETNVMLLPSAGSFTATISAVAITSRIMTANITVENPLSRDEMALFTNVRDDLPPTGHEVRVVLGGINLDFSLYKKLHWGGTSGTAPVTTVAEGPVVVTFASPNNISGAAVPYSLAFSIANAELELGNFRAADDSFVRCDVTARMIDGGSTPVTVTLVNTKASY